MCHHDCPFTELQKSWKNSFDPIRIANHRVINGCQFRDMIWNRSVRIDKGTKTIGDRSIFDLYSTNFYDFVAFRTNSCRLQVKHNIRIIKRLSFIILNRFDQIIDQICFDAIQHLKCIVTIHFMICIRKWLYNTVVCDRHCRVSPLFCAFHKFTYRNYWVHLTHLCMCM